MRRWIVVLSAVLWLCLPIEAQVWIRQGAVVTKRMGPFVDEDDGKTKEIALTIQKADVRLSKNGGDYAAANADQGVADAGAPYDENGEYVISLNATDTGTLGHLRVMIFESGALPVWQDFMIVNTPVYDATLDTDNLVVDVTHWLGQDLSLEDYIPTPVQLADAAHGGAATSITLGANSQIRANIEEINGETIGSGDEVALKANLTEINGTLNADAVLTMRQLRLVQQDGFSDSPLELITISSEVVPINVNSFHNGPVIQVTGAIAFTDVPLGAGTIRAEEIANGAIDASAFATDAIGPTTLAADTIGSSEFADSAAAKVAAASTSFAGSAGRHHR